MTTNAITHTHALGHRPTERPTERPTDGRETGDGRRETGDGRARRREVGPSVRRSVGRRARRARRVRPSHRRVDVRFRFGFGVGTGTGTGTPGTEFRESVRDDGRTTKMSSRKSTPDSLEDDDGRSDEEDVGDEVRDDEDEGVRAGRTVLAFSLFLSFFARESSSVRGVDADRWMDRSVRARGVRARVRVRAVEREDGRAWIGG